MFSFSGSKSQFSKKKQQLQALNKAIDAVEGTVWASKDDLHKTLKQVTKTLENDLKDIETCDFIFPDHHSAGAGADDLAGYLREWHMSGGAPSMAALVVATMEVFEITQPDLVQSLLMAAILGEVENDLPYHNNAHFKKVVLQSIRMICVHNGIFAGTLKVLGEQSIATILIAACIHDLGHDGLGNAIKGVFYPGRLERYAYETAAPYLQQTGLSDEILAEIEVLLLVTDVSPLGDITNPMYQMKAAYKFHYMGDKERLHTLNLSDELDVLERNETLALMACMLHEADIATSAGVTYSVTQFETCLFREEIGVLDARPSHIIDFMDKVCQRAFLTDAGQKLFGANMARIIALAEEEDDSGNQMFPNAKHTNFALGAPGAEHAKDKTLN